MAIRFLKNQRGVSLAGTLVAVGMVAIVSFASLILFNTNLLQQKFVEQKYAVTNLHKEIYDQLTNEQSCKSTFSAAAGQLLKRDDIDGPTEEFAFTKIKSPDGATDVFKKYSTSADPTYDNGLIRIDDFRLKGYQDQGLDGNNRYTATAILEAKYKQNSKTVGAEVFRPKQIKIHFTFYRTDPTPPAGPDAAQDKEVQTCKAIGGSGDSFWSLTPTGDGIFYSEKVGIGTNNPRRALHIEHNGTNNGIGLTNSGGAPNNITEVFSDVGDIGVLNYGHTAGAPSGRLDLRVENAPRLSILQSNGNVGIGTTAPNAKLEVSGGIMPGSQTSVVACGMGAANGEGAIRYNYVSHRLEYCNGTNWVNFQSTYTGSTPAIWTAGPSVSQSSPSANIPIPSGCVAPRIFTESDYDSINCWYHPCGPGSPSNTMDIESRVYDQTATHFRVFLSGEFAGNPASSSMNVRWLIVCQ